jgi:Insecticide toxin TcdB middle/N-terminal region/Salmonella virulence plasmid 65kDa B protein/FG-GAP-like repeat
VYGTPRRIQDDPAVIANPENRRQVFHWKLTETRDPFGNLIRYDYERDLGDTVDHLWDQAYLKRIRYTDYTDPETGGERFLISVTFNYDERPDPFSEYRPGFEIRTTRRCTSIEIHTHADRERLVRAYRLIYLDQRDLPIDRLPLNAASLLSQVLVEGHDDEHHHEPEPLPPLEFGYTLFEPRKRRYQPFTGANGSRPERSLANPEYELVDLFGNGLPTVVEFNEQVRYWRNRGNARFDLMRTMETAPAGVRLSEPGVQLLDANGNGRADLMVIDGLRDGYFPLSFDGQWNDKGFVRYRSAPTINFHAPDVRLLDLDGDGVTDALRTGQRFELYYNDPEDGWSRLEVRERSDSASFPNVSFEDPRVKLGDMTGDGLQDMLLIHDGRVDYWPYRGYGRWGRRVTMRNSPRFDDAVLFPGIGFDPQRLLVGDVDGDGVADLVYVSSGHITVWINHDGNAWSDPIVIHGTPPVTDATAVRLADMLGTGTEGILWTYDFGVFPDSTYKFLDLTGGIKPYVLDQMDNHMGAITRVSYATSTRFYVEDDARPQTRWRTPLPFPVQVVARVEVIASPPLCVLHAHSHVKAPPLRARRRRVHQYRSASPHAMRRQSYLWSRPSSWVRSQQPKARSAWLDRCVADSPIRNRFLLPSEIDQHDVRVVCNCSVETAFRAASHVECMATLLQPPAQHRTGDRARFHEENTCDASGRAVAVLRDVLLVLDQAVTE